MMLMTFSSDAISATNNSSFDLSPLRHSHLKPSPIHNPAWLLPSPQDLSFHVLSRLEQTTSISLGHALCGKNKFTGSDDYEILLSA